GQRSNAFYYAGGDYKLSKDLTAQYYYGNLEDFYTQHFLGLKHNLSLPVGSLKTDLRYFYSDSNGKNASQEGRLEGYKASGKSGTNGEVDNRTWSVLSTYSLSGHSIGAGYQQSNGDSDFPFLNQGDGSTAYLITNKQIGKFQRAGERTWLAQYGYDFASLGVRGLTTSVSYLAGDHIQAAGTGNEWERDFTLGYVVPDGKLKGLGMTWRNASIRSGVTSQRDQDQNRIILSYTVALF
ncbi:MAG TPA: OprD family outer membrane porin, partial [Pseudomonas sp.]|uniref:OprD family outer membrane porin n=1 Tax=Pseudomonas sp. TaxID=306 RepID=UPI002ED790F0